MDRMFSQILSFAISIILVISLIYLMKVDRGKRFFYLYFVVSFFAEAIYYLFVLFGDGSSVSHDLSAPLRMFQTIMFGSPFLFDVVERIYTKIKVYKVLRKVKTTLKKQEK